MGGPWISWEALAWKGSGVQLLLCLLFFTGSATFVIRDGGGWLHKMTREKVPFKCTLMVKLGPWAGVQLCTLGEFLCKGQ